MGELYEGMAKMDDQQVQQATKEQLADPSKVDVVCMRKCKAHAYHKDCLQRQQGKKEHIKCAVCGVVYGTLVGDMPPGTMKWEKTNQYTCSGYEGHGVITIRYQFPDGERPDMPGVRYSGTGRLAYLPDCPEGVEVLAILEKAFRQRVSFVVGTSVTTGEQNTVVWGSVHHKTNTTQG